MIDVGDSAAAPHQSRRDQRYYYRVGGRSLRAQHFYLELLRQRLSNPALEFKLNKLSAGSAYEHDDGIFVEGHLEFKIPNVGRVASYHWNLLPKQMTAIPRLGDYPFSRASFPRKGDGLTGIPLNTIILPGCDYFVNHDFGFQLRPKTKTIEAVREDIDVMLSHITLFYKLATETTPGELMPVALSPLLDIDVIATLIGEQCPRFSGA